MEYNFKYSLSEDEYAEYNAFSGWHAPWQKKARFKYLINTAFFFFIAIIATVIVIDKFEGDETNFTSLLIISSIITLIFTFFSNYQAPFRFKSKARLFIRKDENAHLINESEIEISDRGIYKTNPETKVNLNWNSIIKYAVSENLFYLYVNSQEALVIPKRLFESQIKIEEFDKFLTEKIPLSSSFRSIGS